MCSEETLQLVTEVSVHAPGPPQGVAIAQWDKDIPAGQTLPNPDDAGPIVRHHTCLPVMASCDTALDSTQGCSDASSTTMQCLRRLFHLGGLITDFLIHFQYFEEVYTGCCSKRLYSESTTNDYVRSPPSHRKTQPFFSAKEWSHKNQK